MFPFVATTYYVTKL